MEPHTRAGLPGYRLVRRITPLRSVPLARLEAVIALRSLLQRFPNLRRGDDPAERHGYFFLCRAFKS